MTCPECGSPADAPDGRALCICDGPPAPRVASFTKEQQDVVAPVIDALADLREAVAMHLRYLDSVEQNLRGEYPQPTPDPEVAANIIKQQKRNLRLAGEKTGPLDYPRSMHFADPPRRRRRKAA